MAEGEEALEDALCRFLSDCYPTAVPLEAISKVVNQKSKKVNKILQRNLMPKGLCQKTIEREQLCFHATELLVKQLCPQQQPIHHSRGRSQEMEPAMRGSPPVTPMQLSETPSQQQGSLTPRSAARKWSSLLPIKVMPKSDGRPASVVPMHTTGGHTWGMGYSCQTSQTGMIVQSNATLHQGFQQQVVVYQPSPDYVMQTQYKQPDAPLRNSLLKLKRVSKQKTPPPTQQKTPPPEPGPRKETVSESRIQRSNRFYVDGSMFPSGLWNHVLFETREIRSRMATADKLLARTFTPDVKEKEIGGQMSGYAKETPEGRGVSRLSMDAVTSLNAMGPSPPGFTITPRDQASSEVTDTLQPPEDAHLVLENENWKAHHAQATVEVFSQRE